MNFESVRIRILSLDLKGCLYLNQFSKRHHIAHFFKVISRLGDGIFWYVMLAATWVLQGIHYSLQMLYMMCGGIGGTLIYKYLKSKTVRPRPYQVHQVIRLGERPLDHFSFPSGHTLHAVMVTMMLGYVQPVLLILMLPFTLLVAVSRMILGLHYPTDVLVGAALGAVIASMVILFAPVLGLVL